MTPNALLAELRNRGVEPVVREGPLKLRGPAGRITHELVLRVRQHKAVLLAHLQFEEQRATAEQALVVLNRLKCYALPAGRISAAREIAERCAAKLLGYEDCGLLDARPVRLKSKCQPDRLLQMTLSVRSSSSSCGLIPSNSS
jgi:hypothetical protein